MAHRQPELWGSETEYRLEIVETSTFNHLVNASIENTLSALGHICCRWAWAYRILSWSHNYEHKTRKVLVRIPITEQQYDEYAEILFHD